MQRRAARARASGAPTGARSIAPQGWSNDSDAHAATRSSELQRALVDAGLDGWLLYDFRGLNPIAAG